MVHFIILALLYIDVKWFQKIRIYAQILEASFVDILQRSFCPGVAQRIRPNGLEEIIFAAKKCRKTLDKCLNIVYNVQVCGTSAA